MSKNKRKNVEEETIEEEEETSITNVKHPRLKSASRIASSNPSSIALPEILENENIPLNTHKTAKKNELVASFTNFVDGEKSVTKETLESSDSRKPQIDNLEKDEILASFEVLTSGEGKTREQAYKIIGDIKGKSMKTNILRWIKERDDLLRTGTPKQDGRKERRTSIDDSIISSKANNIDAADGTSSPVKKTGGIKVAPSCAHALASGQLAPIPPSVLPVIRREEGDKAKPQVDETQKDELLTYFDYLIKTEGKRAEEAYRIIAEQCGKSMKTNILRWKKERLDAQDAGESRSDGRRSNSDFDEAVLEKMTQRNPNIDFVEAVDGSNSSMRYSHEMIQQAAKDVLTTDWRFKDDKRLEALNFSGAWCSHFIGRVGLPKRKIVRKGKDTSASIV